MDICIECCTPYRGVTTIGLCDTCEFNIIDNKKEHKYSAVVYIPMPTNTYKTKKSVYHAGPCLQIIFLQQKKNKKRLS